MPSPIEFYFDFSSPYGYLAATRIGALAARHGRTVDWRPMLLGAAFKATGMAPLPMVPIKGEYSMRDMPRSARFLGVPFNLPARFPISTVAPARLVSWLRRRGGVDLEAAVLALYRAYFVDGVDISAADAAAGCVGALGIDSAEALAAMADPAVKEGLREEVEAAVAAGVFGSPFIRVDGEPFWGVDRLDQVERWLSTGGF